MAATVQIQENNGAGPSTTDKTSGSIRFKNADDATVNTSNPMVKPTGNSVDWSYRKYIGFNVTAGTYTEISNIKAYSDGTSAWTGVNLWARGDSSTYATPAEETANAGYSNFFGYTANGALTLGTGPYTSTGVKGNYLRMAMEVTTAASAGTLAGETLTISWDEI
jgi:hypothetical protein